MRKHGICLSRCILDMFAWNIAALLPACDGFHFALFSWFTWFYFLWFFALLSFDAVFTFLVLVSLGLSFLMLHDFVVAHVFKSDDTVDVTFVSKRPDYCLSILWFLAASLWPHGELRSTTFSHSCSVHNRPVQHASRHDLPGFPKWWFSEVVWAYGCSSPDLTAHVTTPV